jgi:hypothetical protein
LNDLVNKDLSINFFLPFNDFQDSPLPKSVEEYLTYKKNVENFIQNRNDRITNETKFYSNQTKVNIPFMVTKRMKMKLDELGYSNKEISNMTPSQSWELINKGRKK